MTKILKNIPILFIAFLSVTQQGFSGPNCNEWHTFDTTHTSGSMKVTDNKHMAYASKNGDGKAQINIGNYDADGNWCVTINADIKSSKTNIIIEDENDNQYMFGIINNDYSFQSEITPLTTTALKETFVKSKGLSTNSQEKYRYLMFVMDHKQGVLTVHQNSRMIKEVKSPVFSDNRKLNLVIQSNEEGEGISILDPSLYVPLDYMTELQRTQLSKEVAAQKLELEKDEKDLKDKDATIKKLEAELKTAKSQIVALKSEDESQKQEISKLNKDISDRNIVLKNYEHNNSEMRKKIASQKTTIADNDKEIAKNDKDIAQLKATAVEHLNTIKETKEHLAVIVKAHPNAQKMYLLQVEDKKQKKEIAHLSTLKKANDKTIFVTVIIAIIAFIFFLCFMHYVLYMHCCSKEKQKMKDHTQSLLDKIEGHKDEVKNAKNDAKKATWFAQIPEAEMNHVNGDFGTPMLQILSADGKKVLSQKPINISNIMAPGTSNIMPPVTQKESQSFGSIDTNFDGRIGVYIGQILDGSPHGYGMIELERSILFGDWEDNRLVKGVEFSKDHGNHIINLYPTCTQYKYQTLQEAQLQLAAVQNQS